MRFRLRSRPLSQQLLLMLATILLIAVAAGALVGVVRQFSRLDTVGQALETVVQLALGVMSVWLAAGAIAGRSPGRTERRVWTTTLVTTAAGSALVWGPPMVLPAIVFGAAALAVAAGVGWLLARATRTPVAEVTGGEAPPDESLHLADASDKPHRVGGSHPRVRR